LKRIVSFKADVKSRAHDAKTCIDAGRADHAKAISRTALSEVPSGTRNRMTARPVDDTIGEAILHMRASIDRGGSAPWRQLDLFLQLIDVCVEPGARITSLGYERARQCPRHSRRVPECPKIAAKKQVTLAHIALA
jgi:hypothetical protein